MSLPDLIMRIDGEDQKYGRNQIKKIILVERLAPQQSPPAQSAPAKSH